MSSLREVGHFYRFGLGCAHVAKNHNCASCALIVLMDEGGCTFDANLDTIASNQSAVCTTGHRTRSVVFLFCWRQDSANLRAATVIDDPQHVRHWAPQCLLAGPSGHLFRGSI